MKRIQILDIPFDTVDEYGALNVIMGFLKEGVGKKRMVATPNPEMLLAARRNPQFCDILKQTDLNIADGTGILWAATYLEKAKNIKSRTHKVFLGLKELLLMTFNPTRSKKVLPQRVTGTDMMELICKNVDGNHTVFLLGGAGITAQKTAEKLKAKYGTKVIGTNNGSADTAHDNAIIKHINDCSPQILFVAFGAPKQELWLARNLHKLNTVKVAIGVGGAFDFISGNTKRAPLFMRRIGLEWLYRLIIQPSRVKRIINATIVFPARVIKSTL